MAYNDATNSPPNNLVEVIGGSGVNLSNGIFQNNGIGFYSMQGTDTFTGTVDQAGYISDAAARGLAPGDVVFYKNTTTLAVTIARVTAVNALTGAANLSAGLVIT